MQSWKNGSAREERRTGSKALSFSNSDLYPTRTTLSANSSYWSFTGLTQTKYILNSRLSSNSVVYTRGGDPCTSSRQATCGSLCIQQASNVWVHILDLISIRIVKTMNHNTLSLRVWLVTFTVQSSSLKTHEYSSGASVAFIQAWNDTEDSSTHHLTDYGR